MDTTRIVELSKKQGKSMTHLCKLIGKYRNYFADVRSKDLTVPTEYLVIIAEDLGTTVEYLTWQTDDPNPVQAESVEKRKTAIRIPVCPFLGNASLPREISVIGSGSSS